MDAGSKLSLVLSSLQLVQANTDEINNEIHLVNILLYHFTWALSLLNCQLSVAMATVFYNL